MRDPLPSRRRSSWEPCSRWTARAFGAGIWAIEGPTKGQEFFAGYLLEQSLSVDNLFVFVLVFSYFKTPVSGQQKVLQYGIGTAAVLRAILIVTGVELVERCEPVLILFAAILITSSWKLLTQCEVCCTLCCVL
ncbi:hypothetical protein FOA52_000681 [Chlamydomonas sp. UWO 241]|nr:hypothetical protein FOA52_000681 [Chlamydomonas sp. UWO 241]